MGVASAIGNDLDSFKESLKQGRCGIRHFPELEALNFSCQLGAMPVLTDSEVQRYFSPLFLKGFNSPGILYGVYAGLSAWEDAGFSVARNETADPDTGVIFGMGNSSAEKYRESIYLVDAGKTKRLGSTSVPQVMVSAASAYLGGFLGCGNQVMSNSSACSTGTESILLAYERIKSGRAIRMVAGSCADGGPYIWSGFDAMRVTNYRSNDAPERSSRPMSASAGGFIPGSGAGAMVLERLDAALDRGAQIYAEVLGGHINSGGQRQGGTLTAPNPEGVVRCIQGAIRESAVDPHHISAINGHLTATVKDPDEIRGWIRGLGVPAVQFPPINSLKSLCGHGLSAAGAMECVAAVLQVKFDFLFGNLNVEDLHPEIAELVPSDAILQDTVDTSVNTVIKASFGFGDVNAAILFSKYTD